MTAIMPMDEPIPHGSFMGKQVSGPRLTAAEHFRKCPLCGRLRRHARSGLARRSPRPDAAPGVRSVEVNGFRSIKILFSGGSVSIVDYDRQRDNEFVAILIVVAAIVPPPRNGRASEPRCGLHAPRRRQRDPI